MSDKTIRLTDEEQSFIHIQLSARKPYFMNELLEATHNRNTVRVNECTRACRIIDSIIAKLLKL